jgi:hypothetical protein
MANPATAIEEAIASALDGWKPENGQELYDFIKALPDVYDHLGAATQGVLETADEHGDLEEVLGEEIGELETAANNAQGAAQTLAEQFEHHYKFFLSGE